MIIDVHYHIYVEEWFSNEFRDFLCKILVKFFGMQGKEVTQEEVRKNILESMYDPTGEKMIERMDELGIDKCLILALDYGIGLGEGRISVEEQNRTIAEIANRYPDRAIAFAGIDPRRGDAVRLLEKCVKEWGMKGLKYHCDAGFYPNSEDSNRLLRKAVELRIPLLTHVSPLPPPVRAKYVHPSHLSDVMVDHPDLNIIAAHAGGGCWWPEVATMVSLTDRLSADIAMWQFYAKQYYQTFCQTLRSFLDIAGAKKVLFATDGPIFEPLVDNKEWIQLIKDLPEKAPEGIKFTREEVDGILGKNAQRILGM